VRTAIHGHEVAPRLMTGAFILNSGLSKMRSLKDEEAAKGVHGMATTAYPFIGRMPPATFFKLLAGTEVALGSALLLPLVPTPVVGAGLTAFSSGLIGLYLRIPGMRREGSLAPTEQGIVLAKDSWMLGIGLGFLTEGLSGHSPHRGRRRSGFRGRPQRRRR
jgi:uncharacterized membrane protein YphA (DoxX/SURF4 family)